MSLIITEGQIDLQDMYEMESFETNVVAKIFNVAINENDKDSLDISLEILSGNYKYETFVDTIKFNGNEQETFKYKTLRESACRPFYDNEDKTIDIESYLKDKIVILVLHSYFCDDELNLKCISYTHPCMHLISEVIEYNLNIDKEI